MVGQARKPSVSTSQPHTNQQPSSSTTTRHPRQRSKSATTTNDDDKYAPHRRISLAVDSSSRPSTPASTSVSRTASPAPTHAPASAFAHTPTATRRQQQPTTTTLRPPGSAEYRYSLGPAPVRFPKSIQKQQEGGEESGQSSKQSQTQSQSQRQSQQVTDSAAASAAAAIVSPARPRIIKRPSSKVLTTFPFPHPTTPGHEDGSGGAGDHSKRLGFGWVGKLFSRRTEDDEDVEAQQQQQRSEQSPLLPSFSRPNSHYGSAATHPPSPSPRPTHPRHSTSASSDSLPDPSDPYGYRRLAGPQLLPDYHSNRARTRTRTRTRTRQGWFDRQRRMTTVFTILCLVALAASALGWWVARGEDLRGKIPKRIRGGGGS